MADIFAVVADPTRRDLLRILHTRGVAPTGATGELSVSQLVAELGLSQPTVSKHLRVLRDAGLVSVREKGQHRFYRLQAAPLYAVEEWLRPFGGATVPTNGHGDEDAGRHGRLGGAADSTVDTGPASTGTATGAAATGAAPTGAAATGTAPTGAAPTGTAPTGDRADDSAVGIGTTGAALATALGRLAADLQSRAGWITGSRSDTPR
ncbi:ArsR/SmtB family transcription factor [Planctomonas psychrotolerans]|uniref:ArsR/SmtB family transcription factor n=1 Tax=Planctomonas psychrotolerans TaxID=2528712 RepID=UPI0038736A26